MSIRQLSVPVHGSPGDEPVLYLDLTRRGRVSVIMVSGEVDLYTAHLITELVGQVARDRPSSVVLDLAGVSFFGADGIHAPPGLLRHDHRRGRTPGAARAVGADLAGTHLTETDHLFPLASIIADGCGFADAALTRRYVGPPRCGHGGAHLQCATGTGADHQRSRAAPIVDQASIDLRT
jgi:hypothetical protein